MTLFANGTSSLCDELVAAEQVMQARVRISWVCTNLSAWRQRSAEGGYRVTADWAGVASTNVYEICVSWFECFELPVAIEGGHGRRTLQNVHNRKWARRWEL